MSAFDFSSLIHDESCLRLISARWFMMRDVRVAAAHPGVHFADLSVLRHHDGRHVREP